MKNVLKKAISILLVAVMIFGSAPLAGFVGLELPELNLFNTKAEAAETVIAPASDFEYTVGADGNITITKYIGQGGSEVKVPSAIDGKPVTTIGESSFENVSNIYGILFLPDSIKTIEQYAFRYSCIPQINFGEGIETIGDYAFSESQFYGGCIGKGLKYIGTGAFQSYNLESLMYLGTQDEWNAVEIADGNDALNGKVVCLGKPSGKSNIKSYDLLDSAYDSFVYVGTEVYEVNNGELTDYIVSAGDWLEFRTYIKSDFYVGQSSIYSLFDNSFFDVSSVADNAVINSENSSVYGETKMNVRSDAASNIGQITNITNLGESVINSNNAVVANTTFDTAGSRRALNLTNDDWFYSYKVQVKEGLADGITASVSSPIELWQSYPDATMSYPNSVRVSTGTIESMGSAPMFTGCRPMYTMVSNGTLQHVFVDDMSHEFTISNGEDGESYNVFKYDNEGYLISHEEYPAGTVLNMVPNEYSSEDYAGTINIATGKLIKDFIMPASNIKVRDVSTSERFDMRIHLEGGTVDTSALPDYIIDNGDGTLTAKIPFNSELSYLENPEKMDMNDIFSYLYPEKEGYYFTGVFETEDGITSHDSYTLTDINGVDFYAVYEQIKYTAKFYNSIDDAEPIKTVSTTQNSTVSVTDLVAPEGKKFAGWADFETGLIVSTTPTFSYTFSKSKSFYAVWEDYDSAITIMVRDYENGSGWKVGAISYGDSGTSLSYTKINELIVEAAESADANIGYVGGVSSMPYLLENETDTTSVTVTSGITFNGHVTYYLLTTVDFNVTWKIPVFDETTGNITSEYTEITSAASTALNGETDLYSVNVLPDVDVTPSERYVFSGWIDEATGEQIDYDETSGITLNVSSGKDRTFIAKYVASGKYFVNWIVDGETISSAYCSAGEELVAPDAPEKEGYVFVGWTPEVPATMPRNDIEFTAVYVLDKHTVTWIVDGVETVVEYSYGDEIAVPETPYKEGYTFIGWDSEIPSTMPEEDLIFTAQWEINKYTVTWSVDGVETVVEYNYGDKIIMPETPSNGDYVFGGWTPYVPATMPDYDLYFTATWVSNFVGGQCGDNVTWSFNESTCELTISGTGNMDDFITASAPWYRLPVDSVTISEGVTSIGNCAFYELDGLENVTIPDSVTSIGEDAFRSCNELTSITLPQGVTSIGEKAFYFCIGLTSITVSSENTVYSSDDYGVLFNKDKTELIQYPAGNTRTDYVIPDGVTIIGDFAFDYCHKLTSITIPDGVTSIGTGAFCECANLESIKLSDSLISIGEGAFAACRKLRSVIIPESVTSIDGFAFSSCVALDYIHIPSGVTSIAEAIVSSDAEKAEFIEEIREMLDTSDEEDLAYFAGMGITKEMAENYSLTTLICSDSEDAYAKTFAAENGNQFSVCNGHDSVETPETPDLITGVCGDNLTWTFNESTSELFISGTGDMWSSMSALSNIPWYSYLSSIKTVTIADGVTSIGSIAFCGSSVTSVTIPSSVKSVGLAAFRECKNLKDLTLPEGLKKIDYDAFNGCTSLTSVEIPNSITYISDDAFPGCTNLADITIRDGATGISRDAFDNTAAYNNSANWDGDVFYIGNRLIKANETLSGNYRIKEGTKIIGEYASGYCRSLESIEIPDSVTRIEGAAFCFCYNLESITIPDSVTSIGESAFVYCLAMDEIHIPSSVMSIGENMVLSDNDKAYIIEELLNMNDEEFVKYAEMGMTKEEIAGWSTKYVICSDSEDAYAKTFAEQNGNEFAVCDGHDGETPEEPEIPENPDLITGVCGDNLTWTFNESTGELVISGTGVMWDFPEKMPWYDYGEKIKTVTIGDGVTSIGTGAFLYCINLTSVTFPDSLINIGDSAFGACISLTDITLPDSLITIDQVAFAECTGLTSITLPDGLTSIGRLAFENCTSLKSITLPKGLTSIGEKAFSGCTGLTSVVVDYVGTCDFGGDSYIFEGCDAITTVVIGDEVTRIEKYAFSRLINLKNVKIGSGVTSIGNYAFASGYRLTDITIPDNVTSIGDGAFFFCHKLENVTIPDSVTSIGEYAFCYCMAMESLHIPSSVTSIGEVMLLSDAEKASAIEEFLNLIDEDFAQFHDEKGLTREEVLGWPQTTLICSDSEDSAAKTFAEENGNQFAVCNGHDGETPEEPEIPENPDLITGVCGDNLTWTFDESTGKLVISGTGDMYDEPSWPSGYKFVEISEGVTSIGDYAFDRNSTLESITISDSVMSIGDGAFYNSNNLRSVTIGSGVTSIADNAFVLCLSLTNITVDPANTAYSSSEDGVLFNKDKTVLVCYPEGDTRTSYEIPESVTVIDWGAFVECHNLTNVTIPDSVTSIGDAAFGGCINLESVIIPDSVISIGGSAFLQCPAMEYIHIPSSVTTIGRAVVLSDADKADGIEKIKTDLENATEEELAEYAELGVTKEIVANWQPTTLICSDSENSAAKTFAEENGNQFAVCNGHETEEPVPTSGQCGENLTWSFDAATGELTISGTGAMYDYEYTNEVPWNSYKPEIKTVTIGEEVTHIGLGAFAGCSALISAVIPDNVTSMGDGVFYACENLRSVTLSKNLTSIPFVTFGMCPNLTSVKIPDGVTAIGNSAFDHCESLTGIVIPDSVTSIGERAFAECYELTSISIPGSVTSIADSAFTRCLALQYVHIPTSVTSIGANILSETLAYICNEVYDCYAKNYADENGIEFRICAEHREVEDIIHGTCGSNLSWILDTETGVLTISGSGDMDNYNVSVTAPWYVYRTYIKSIVIEDGVTSVGNYTFTDLPNVSDVSMAESITKIGERSFENCSRLNSIDIGNNVTSIGDHAFYSCEGLKSITIPDSVTVLGAHAFGYCDSLESVVIGSGLTAIDSYCFYSCNSLKYLEIGSNVTHIAGHAFSYCNNLQTVVVPESLKTISAYAFDECKKISNVYYAGTWEQWCQIKFGYYNSGLLNAAIYCQILPDEVPDYGDTPEVPSNNIEWNLNRSTGTLYISGTGPMKNYSANESAPWYIYQSQINSVVIEDGITSVGDYSFYDFSGITSVTLPETITRIGSYAFYSCDNLEDINLGDKVKEIGDYAFYSCEKIKNITLGNKVNTIGSHVFYGCEGLTEITIPDSVTSVGDHAFYGSGIESLTVGNGMKQIGSHVFSGCGSLRKAIIRSGVESIASNVFSSCADLSAVFIPLSVTHIYSSAFSSCKNISDVYYEGSAENWESISFGYNNSNLIDATIHFGATPGNFPVTGIQLEQTEAQIENHKTLQLNAAVVPAVTNNPRILWTSSDESVATVDENGVVTAVSVGTATVTATTEEGSFSAECVVTVTPAKLNLALNIDGVKTNVTVEEGAPISIEDPVKIGHTFVEWYPEMPETMPCENLEFTAVFETNTYTVEWDIDGLIMTESYKFGDAIDKAKTFNKKGYTLVGWTPEIPDTMPDHDLSFSAIFEINHYDAVFNTNGGLFPDGDSFKRVSTEYNAAIAVPQNPERSGYEFAGWAYNGKNIGTDLGIMNSVEGKTFEAIWIPQSTAFYKVETYTMNTAGEYEVSTMLFNAVESEIVSVNPAVNEGFEVNTEKSVLSGTVSAEEMLVLKVYIDRKQYSFTTVTDGTETSVLYYYGAIIVEPSIPVKDGYVFTGWNKDIPVTMPSNDVTVTANFKVAQQDTATTRIVMVTPEKRTVYYGESITLQVRTYNLPDGAKVKWEVSGDGVSIKPSSSGKTCKVTSTSNGNVVIKAYVVDSKGNTISGKDGKPVCDSEYLYSEVNLWQVIVNFFKQLLGLNDSASQTFKGIF